MCVLSPEPATLEQSGTKKNANDFKNDKMLICRTKKRKKKNKNYGDKKKV